MRYTWLGHGSIKLEIADQVLLIDPWLADNPSFPDDRRDEALAGVTAILVTHGHGDHAPEVCGIARETGAPIYGIADLMTWWGQTEDGVEVNGFNNGGTVQIGDAAVTMVNAVHSSSMPGENGPIYTGAEAGFMIEGEGRCVYVSGDTDVMADMGVLQELHAPEIGILCAGGAFYHGHEAGCLRGLDTIQVRHRNSGALQDLSPTGAVGRSVAGGPARGTGARPGGPRDD